MLKRNIFKEGSTESQARREVLTVRSSSDHASKAVANCANCALTNPDVVEHMRSILLQDDCKHFTADLE